MYFQLRRRFRYLVGNNKFRLPTNIQNALICCIICMKNKRKDTNSQSVNSCLYFKLLFVHYTLFIWCGCLIRLLEGMWGYPSTQMWLQEWFQPILTLRSQSRSTHTPLPPVCCRYGKESPAFHSICSKLQLPVPTLQLQWLEQQIGWHWHQRGQKLVCRRGLYSPSFCTQSCLHWRPTPNILRLECNFHPIQEQNKCYTHTLQLCRQLHSLRQFQWSQQRLGGSLEPCCTVGWHSEAMSATWQNSSKETTLTPSFQNPPFGCPAVIAVSDSCGPSCYKFITKIACLKGYYKVEVPILETLTSPLSLHLSSLRSV